MPHANWGGRAMGPHGGGHGWASFSGGRPQWHGGGGHQFATSRHEGRMARAAVGRQHFQREARGSTRAGQTRFANEARVHNRGGQNAALAGGLRNSLNRSTGNLANGRAQGSQLLARGGQTFASRNGFAAAGNRSGFGPTSVAPRYDRAGVNMARNGMIGAYGAGRPWTRLRDTRDLVATSGAAGSPLIAGCPPGRGCGAPGGARALWGYADPYDNWYTYADWYHYDDRYDWRYYDGYLYRIDPATLLIGAFLPLLGGALYDGNVWPVYYEDDYVDPYYVSYYGYEPADYDYRYGDGAIFAVDRGSHRINNVVALITGDDWVVGQRMPDGYDFYNVPPEYRDRYYDRDDAWYRYSDGYVYEVDPATLVVRQAIELLATT
jgi:hypothetical protein